VIGAGAGIVVLETFVLGKVVLGTVVLVEVLLELGNPE
jgi:hypothetical protein